MTETTRRNSRKRQRTAIKYTADEIKQALGEKCYKMPLSRAQLLKQSTRFKDIPLDDLLAILKDVINKPKRKHFWYSYLPEEMKQTVNNKEEIVNELMVKYCDASETLDQRIADGKTRNITATKDKDKWASKLTQADSILTNLKKKMKDLKTITESPTHIHDKQLDTHRIFKNKYFKNLEGNQSIAYRKCWSKTTAHISGTTFYQLMEPAVDTLNQFYQITASTKCVLSSELISKAKELSEQFIAQWQRVINECETEEKFSLGAKVHYLGHCVEYMETWKCGIAWLDEQSIEAFHQLFSSIKGRYKTQRGICKTEYFIKELLFVTSPLHQA